MIAVISSLNTNLNYFCHLKQKKKIIKRSKELWESDSYREEEMTLSIREKLNNRGEGCEENE